jgi:hypothetical protein
MKRYDTEGRDVTDLSGLWDEADHIDDASHITAEWLKFIAGEPDRSKSGMRFWDIPICTEFSSGDTALRIHDRASDGSWCTELLSQENEVVVAIVNWPKTREQLSDLMRVLGCVRKCSLCQGIYDDGECAACGRKLTAIPVGG